MLSLLRKNRDAVLQHLAEAAHAAGREPASIELVAVTKTVRPEVALGLAELGQLDLGENRIASLEEKVAFFQAKGREVRWHFIGHLQRNKARRVARLVHTIHAVDTPALLATLGRISAEEGLRPGLYLQVKLNDEEAKYGLSPQAVPELVREAGDQGARLLGLMTMAPLVEADPAAKSAAARDTFERLAALAAELPAASFDGGRPRLSMGMSGDLTEAVEAGADTVRIGTALFRGLEEAA
ncbi:MAG: YggS family pyridoxal phosphate-dependent enzyme [Planctomycetota bacterium]